MYGWRCKIARNYSRVLNLVLRAVIIALSSIVLPLSHASHAPYGTYFGGDLYEGGYDSAIDSTGNLYITGQTYSSTFNQIPTQTLSSTNDLNCFIVRIDINAPETRRALILGGNNREACRKISVNQQGLIHVIGETKSSDLPVTNGTKLNGEWDGFIFVLDTNFNILFGSYLGGSDTDFAHGLTLNKDGDIFITGETWSTDFPTSSNAYQTDCLVIDSCDANSANSFFMQISNAAGNYQRVYSTYLGGSHNDKAHSISVYGNQVLITGETQSTDFPLIHQLSDSLRGSLDAFISVFELSGNQQAQLIFSSYLGGNGNDAAMDARFDNNGNILIIGESDSKDFPVQSNQTDSCISGVILCTANSIKNTDTFITMLNHNHVLEFSILVGGTSDDTPSKINLTNNTLWISGTTASHDFPITDNAYFTTCQSTDDCETDYDGFILNIDLEESDSPKIKFASYFGGEKQDSINGTHIFKNHLILIGESNSPTLFDSSGFNSTAANGDLFLQLFDYPDSGNLLTRSTPTVRKTPAAASVNSLFLFAFLLAVRIFRESR